MTYKVQLYRKAPSFGRGHRPDIVSFTLAQKDWPHQARPEKVRFEPRDAAVRLPLPRQRGR